MLTPMSHTLVKESATTIDSTKTIMLGSTDFQSEHLGRFDVVGNSHDEKLAVFERIIRGRIADRPEEPQTHYLPISYVRHGSVIDLHTD